MNNDIRNDYPKYINAQNIGPKFSADKSAANKPVIDSENLDSITNSMKILSALGHAQVNMGSCVNRGITHSVEQYIQDPIFAQSWVEYCDSLVEKGYNLEDALIKTDRFFSVLKDKNIYS